jgi:hypothetical protein
MSIFTVFVHSLDMSGMIIAQNDSQPQEGASPTSFWDAGEIVRDEHMVQMPPNLAAGNYRVEVGLYRLDSGARLPITLNRTGDEITLPLVLQVY